jgi:rhamnosyltransferase
VPRDPTTQPGIADVLAVLVCYQPHIPTVVAIVRDLLETGAADVLLVDNTEGNESCAQLHDAVAGLNVEVACIGANVGVAEAHNVGLRRARERGHQAVLLLDQDTRLEKGTLGRLRTAMNELNQRGERVAAVGARFVDPRNGFKFPFVRLQGLRMRPVPASATPVECDLLISSGSLISLAVVDAVGEMDASMFIDYVDIEWCLRARAAGYKVFGVSAARMEHTIGDSSLRVFGRNIPVHAPARQYYLIRNALLLARKPYLSLSWRGHLLYRVAAQMTLFSFFCAPRLKRLGWMLRGLADGMIGRGGRVGGTPVRSQAPHFVLPRTAPEANAVDGRPVIANARTPG